MRARGERKPYAILGASGSGKIIAFEGGAYCLDYAVSMVGSCLRSFQPGADPLLNLAKAIAMSLGEKRAPGSLRDSLRATWDRAEKQDGFATDAGLRTLRATLESEVFTPIRKRADRPGATVLLPLDQAEELARAEGEGADALCDYLRAALLSPTSTDNVDVPAAGAMIVLTARSDSFPELQTARRFTGLDACLADIRPVSAIPLQRSHREAGCPLRRPDRSWLGRGDG